MCTSNQSAPPIGELSAHIHHTGGDVVRGENTERMLNAYDTSKIIRPRCKDARDGMTIASSSRASNEDCITLGAHTATTRFAISFKSRLLRKSQAPRRESMNFAAGYCFIKRSSNVPVNCALTDRSVSICRITFAATDDSDSSPLSADTMAGIHRFKSLSMESKASTASPVCSAAGL